MFSTSNGPQPTHSRFYDFTQATCCCSDLNVAPGCREKHDERDTIHKYLVTVREDTMELSDLVVSVYAPSQQELKIVERPAAYIADDIDKVGHINELEQQPLKWKAYNRNVRKHREGISKKFSSKSENPSSGTCSYCTWTIQIL